jgi:hypothetical protein
MLLARPVGILATDELTDEERAWDIVQLLGNLIVKVGAKPATTRANSLVLGEFDHNRYTRQVLGECLATGAFPGALRFHWAVGNNFGSCRRDGLIVLLGEESKLVEVDAFTARAVFLTQEYVHRMFELLDPPLCVLE